MIFSLSGPGKGFLGLDGLLMAGLLINCFWKHYVLSRGGIGYLCSYLGLYLNHWQKIFLCL